MRFEIILLLITIALVYNTYYDGKLINMIKIDVKYFKIASYVAIAFVIYIFIKKQPFQTRSLLIHANDIIRYMPIDKNSKNIITPILDYTKDKFLTGIDKDNIGYDSSNETHTVGGFSLSGGGYKPTQDNRIINSGKNTIHKRSVSETKKKYVASNQSWKCGHCNNPLDHTYEIDHIMDLQHGGDNNVNNLIALCRNCHGKKTVQSKL